MEEQSNVCIQIRLDSVSELDFRMSLSGLSDDINPDDIQIGFSNRIVPDIPNGRISLIFGVVYEIHGSKVLECVYEFAYSVVDLDKFVTLNNDDSITVAHIMPHLLSVAVGTMRGILLVKTAGTYLARFPIPIIDVNELNRNFSTGVHD